MLLANLLKQKVRLLKDTQPSMLSSRNKLVMPAPQTAIVNTTRQTVLTRVSYTNTTFPHFSPKGCWSGKKPFPFPSPPFLADSCVGFVSFSLSSPSPRCDRLEHGPGQGGSATPPPLPRAVPDTARRLPSSFPPAGGTFPPAGPRPPLPGERRPGAPRQQLPCATGQGYRHLPERGTGSGAQPRRPSPGRKGWLPSQRGQRERRGRRVRGRSLTSEPVSADAQETQGAAAQHVPLPVRRGPLPVGSPGVAPGSPPAAASLPHGAGPAGDLPAGRVRPAAAAGAGARRLLLLLLLPWLERRRLFVPASARDDHLRIVPAGAGAPRRRGGEPSRGGRGSARSFPHPLAGPGGHGGGAAAGGLVVTGRGGGRSALRRRRRPLRPAGHVGAGAVLPAGRGAAPAAPAPPPCSRTRRPGARRGGGGGGSGVLPAHSFPFLPGGRVRLCCRSPCGRACHALRPAAASSSDTSWCFAQLPLPFLGRSAL